MEGFRNQTKGSTTEMWEKKRVSEGSSTTPGEQSRASTTAAELTDSKLGSSRVSPQPP